MYALSSVHIIPLKRCQFEINAKFHHSPHYKNVWVSIFFELNCWEWAVGGACPELTLSVGFQRANGYPLRSLGTI